jgi:hypothetical protein
MSKEKIDRTNKFILPPNKDAWSDESRKQIVENLQKITPEQARAVWEELENLNGQKKQEAEQKKWNLDPEKLSDELPWYTQEIRDNFLKLKGVDKLEKIDKFVSDLEDKGYISRCSYDWWLVVLINIPWYPSFKYFEPNFAKHSLDGSYRWRFGPYCQEVSTEFWGKKIPKSEVKYGWIWLLPMRDARDSRDNFILYNYLKDIMEKNNLSFVSDKHDRKFMKILWEYYKKCTWDDNLSTNELIAMRTRVLLSWWYWIQQSEWWYLAWVVECSDKQCGYPFFWPDEFRYVSFFLTDLELLPADYAN